MYVVYIVLPLDPPRLAVFGEAGDPANVQNAKKLYTKNSRCAITIGYYGLFGHDVPAVLAGRLKLAPSRSVDSLINHSNR